MNFRSGGKRVHRPHDWREGRASCGALIQPQWKPTDAKVTCQGCREVMWRLEHKHKRGDILTIDDIDPLGVLDDDLSDGAFWAIHYEMYGGW